MTDFNKYPHVFSPIKVGTMTLKNRIVFAPMICCLETRNNSSKYSGRGALSHAMIFLPYFAAHAPSVRVMLYPPPQGSEPPGQ